MSGGSGVKVKPFVVACIPAFNEERSIARVVLEARRYVDRVIVCDDGSTDMTGEIAEALGALVIKHERNIGKGAAMRSLFKKARELDADIVVTLDADGQHDPKDIPKLVNALIKERVNIVVGSRFINSVDEIPSYRIFGNKMLNLFTDKKVTDTQSGFRVYDKKSLEMLNPAEMGMGVDSELLIKARDLGLKIIEVPISVNYKVERPSKLNPLYHGLDVVLSIVKYLSTRRPLLFYGIPGFSALIISLFFWLWTFRIFTETRGINTNIALIALGATLVGLMLMTTAIILWVLISVLREKL